MKRKPLVRFFKEWADRYDVDATVAPFVPRTMYGVYCGTDGCISIPPKIAGTWVIPPFCLYGVNKEGRELIAAANAIYQLIKDTD